MEMYIHYKALPEGKDLHDVVGELNEILEDVGSVCGGEAGRIDLDLEDERANPKHAQPTSSGRYFPGIPPWRLAAWRSESTSRGVQGGMTRPAL